MSKREGSFWTDLGVVLFMMLVGALVAFPIGAALGSHEAYRQGQIDALEGRVKYRPTTQVVYEEAK